MTMAAPVLDEREHLWRAALGSRNFVIGLDATCAALGAQSGLFSDIRASPLDRQFLRECLAALQYVYGSLSRAR